MTKHTHVCFSKTTTELKSGSQERARGLKCVNHGVRQWEGS